MADTKESLLMVFDSSHSARADLSLASTPMHSAVAGPGADTRPCADLVHLNQPSGVEVLKASVGGHLVVSAAGMQTRTDVITSMTFSKTA